MQIIFNIYQAKFIAQNKSKRQNNYFLLFLSFISQSYEAAQLQLAVHANQFQNQRLY